MTQIYHDYSILCSVSPWVCIQQCNRGWIGLAVCFLVRAKGGSQQARSYSCLIGLRSLPVAPTALLQGYPISVALCEPPPHSTHWADSGYSYRATGDSQLSLSLSLFLPLPPPSPCFQVSRVSSAATTLSPCTPKKILQMRTAPVPAPSKHPWHQQSKPICISTGPSVPVAHGLCISQLLKTQTPNISPMWRTEEGERKKVLSKRMVFISLCCLLFHPGWSSCSVEGCLGHWGLRVWFAKRKLYVTMIQLLHSARTYTAVSNYSTDRLPSSYYSVVTVSVTQAIA